MTSFERHPNLRKMWVGMEARSARLQEQRDGLAAVVQASRNHSATHRSSPPLTLRRTINR
jgi:hypothetical protein